jgi:hypothetical protein
MVSARQTGTLTIAWAEYVEKGREPHGRCRCFLCAASARAGFAAWPVEESGILPSGRITGVGLQHAAICGRVCFAHACPNESRKRKQ